MKRAVFLGIALLLVLLAGACGDGDRTDCAIAQEKLEQCATEVLVASSTATYQRLPLAIGDDCSGINGCGADCVKAASCDAMRLVLLGTPTDPNAAPPNSVTGRGAATFYSCLNTCLETYRKQ